MKTVLFLLLSSGALAFSNLAAKPGKTAQGVSLNSAPNDAMEGTRADFLASAALLVGSSAVSTMAFSTPAMARGRATLEQTYERYTPRILAGGQFYSSEFRRMIEKNDFESIKLATSDPPKKSKEDRAKIDGGVADRAKQAGQFSDARVAVACDLFAAAFSESSISTKTKKMQGESAKLREVIVGINRAAREALGEESGGGGLFGFGGKKSSPAELSKRIRQLYVEGGNAYNQYIFAANEELPLSLQKLPYLK